MKQKFAMLLIVALIALSPILLVACRGETEDPEPEPEPNIRTLLVSESELSAGLASGLFDYFLTKFESERDVSLTVRLHDSNSYAYQPRIFLITLDLNAQTVAHELIWERRFRIQPNDNIRLDHEGFLFPRQFENFHIDEIVTFYIIDYRSGLPMHEHGTLQIRVWRVPVPVDSINLRVLSGDDTIQIGRERIITTTVLPTNASFIGVTFVVESIVTPNGQTITGANVNRYVSIVGRGLTIIGVPLGSEINIVAIATEDAEQGILDREPIRSNVLTLVVVDR